MSPIRTQVVLDDDPTGTQTVHDVPVLARWSEDRIASLFAEKAPVFYLLTNSRSLSAADSAELHRELIGTIIRAAKRTGTDFDVISRGDSTLRGHYPLEPDTIRQVMQDEAGVTYDGELLIPFFEEGGRITEGDVHYIAGPDGRIPVGQSEFAHDATFGYASSNLREWIQEKTNGRVAADGVLSVSLDDIRAGGPPRVAEILSDATANARVVVNAVTYADLEPFCRGLADAESRGKRFLFRTAASFVRARAGIVPRPLLEREELVSGNGSGVLCIVGSHVKKTTRQLHHALQHPSRIGLELDVARVIGEQCERYLDGLRAEIDGRLSAGETVVVYTSRQLRRESSSRSERNLDVSVRISRALAALVKSVSAAPRCIIAKGGITSSDIAVHALGVSRARVMGQVLPGIPVWRLGEGSKHPGLAYVIMPGNVGDDNALSAILATVE
ncbi:MAG: hydroxyacid dehydrogenase [Chitinivibrionales bacterium]|nr:hydroxyacid dehydrogenase [Chitinivibrionales bacterium]